MQRTVVGILVAVVMAAGAYAQSGPSSDYYITDSHSGILSVIHGTSIVRSWTQRQACQPIAVADTVRTYGEDYPDFGSEYDVSGNWTGVDYPFQASPPGQLLDGATDGTSRNWLAAFTQSGIWEFDRDWTNPRLLFYSGSPTGVTYDPTTDHLWVIESPRQSIVEYTLTGSVVSYFTYSNTSGWLGCLAWEPSTDTLWASEFSSGEITQFDKSGNVLQSLVIPGLAGYAWGGEFTMCPNASWSNYGAGFPGTSGVPSFTAQNDPVLGTSLTLDLGNSYGTSTVGVLFVGFQRTSIHSGWGGDLLVVPQLISAVSVLSGGTSFFGNLPIDDALCGVTLDLQAIEADPGAAKGVSFTPGLELILGH